MEKKDRHGVLTEFGSHAKKVSQDDKQVLSGTSDGVIDWLKYCEEHHVNPLDYVKYVGWMRSKKSDFQHRG